MRARTMTAGEGAIRAMTARRQVRARRLADLHLIPPTPDVRQSDTFLTLVPFWNDRQARSAPAAQIDRRHDHTRAARRLRRPGARRRPRPPPDARPARGPIQGPPRRAPDIVRDVRLPVSLLPRLRGAH